VIVFLFFFYTDFFNFIHRRLAGPTAGRKSDRGKIKPGKTQSQDLALSIVNGCINIYLNFFLSTCCGFIFLLYVYTIKQKQLKTNDMKNANEMPQWLQDEMNNVQLTNSVNERETFAWYISALTE
jgi:hypothetical protein